MSERREEKADDRLWTTKKRKRASRAGLTSFFCLCCCCKTTQRCDTTEGLSRPRILLSSLRKTAGRADVAMFNKVKFDCRCNVITIISGRAESATTVRGRGGGSFSGVTTPLAGIIGRDDSDTIMMIEE